MDNMDSVSGRYIDMDRARAMVDAKSEELDRRILTPAKETLSRAAAEYPFATIFGSIFLVLSLGPLLAFVCFVVFAGSILLATSLVFFVFWAGVIIGSAAIVLAAILSITFGIAVALTSTAMVAAALRNLYININAKKSIRAGTVATIDEIKMYAVESIKEVQSAVEARGHSSLRGLQASGLSIGDAGGHGKAYMNGHANGHANGQVTIKAEQ